MARAFAAAPVYDRLETFANRAEFAAYLRRVDAITTRYRVARHLRRDAPPVLLAQEGSPCDPDSDDCLELSEVQVTGARAAAQSITNNQVAGVDEGDIVKSWGRFLIVLHDARLFSIDLGDAPGQMQLVDRVDAYQQSDTDAWYDEMLIHDDQVLVTGYSYDEDQTEISLFGIDARGHLALQSRYFISSADYFSGGNYASRLVDGKLVIYTPIDPADWSGPEGISFPKIRSWTPTGGFTRWHDLLSPTDIYRPVDATLQPMIHAVSVCPVLSTKAFRCDARGIVGAWNHELYVSPEAAYLWVNSETASDLLWYWPGRCGEEADAEAGSPRAATLFQLPFRQPAVTAVRAHGDPPDQFSLERRDRMFHALVRRVPATCRQRGEWPLDFISFPLWQFSDTPSPVGDARIHPVPAVGPGFVSARFATDYLAFGAGLGWWRAHWRRNEELGDHRDLVTVNLRDPAQAQVHHLGHSIERVELLGDNLVTFGLTAERELGVTALGLGSAPTLAGSIRLPGVAESEGRSHAFNADVREDGSAVFGLPTAVPTGEENRWGYLETREHVHFFSSTGMLELRPLGSLAGDQLPDNPGYQCDVSCIDWYGNARPIFYRDRVFALLGREFVEGIISGEQVLELDRIDLTLPPGVSTTHTSARADDRL